MHRTEFGAHDRIKSLVWGIPDFRGQRARTEFVSYDRSVPLEGLTVFDEGHHRDNRDRLVDEFARALVRVPYMKLSQLARIRNEHHELAKRALHRYSNVFTSVSYSRHSHRGDLFDIKTNGLRNLVSLTREARRAWAQREGIISPLHIKTASVSRVVATGEVLVSLATHGLYPDIWDLIPAQEQGCVSHAWFVKKGAEDSPIGLFLLPHDAEKWKYKHTLNGILNKVIQHRRVSKILLLVKAEYYERVVRKMVGMDIQGGTLYVLPWERFLKRPTLHLDNVLSDDIDQLNTALMLATPKQRLAMPTGYAFPAFIQDYAGNYRFVDLYGSGNIMRLQRWVRDHPYDRFHILQEVGKSVFGYVYVTDELMLSVLNRLFRDNRTMVYARLISDLYPSTIT